jgi:hypothetical protein
VLRTFATVISKKTMNTKLTIASIIAVIFALGFAGYKLLAPPPETMTAAEIAAATKQTRAELAASANAATGNVVTAPAPVLASTTGSVRAVAVPNNGKRQLQIEFERGDKFKEIFDRYAANPDGADPELKYYAAASLERCLFRTKQKPDSEKERERFTARLKDNDPNNQVRTDAFNTLQKQCEGFYGLNLSGADVSRIFKESAAGGNPAAKLAVMADAYRDQTRAAKTMEERRLSEDQLSTMRDALASKDPAALQRAGNILSYGSTQLQDRKIGQDGAAFNPREWGAAWQLAACDFGGACGSDNARLLSGCANQGYCGYQNLESYMQFNELPPSVYANAQQNRADIINAIQNGRWDWLGIAPGSGRTVVLTPAPAVVKPATPTPAPSPVPVKPKG